MLTGSVSEDFAFLDSEHKVGNTELDDKDKDRENSSNSTEVSDLDRQSGQLALQH